MSRVFSDAARIERMQIANVIDSVGHFDFSARFMGCISAYCDVSHFALYCFNKESLSEVAAASRDGTGTAREQASHYISSSYWQRDRALVSALHNVDQGKSLILRTDTHDMPDQDFRQRFFSETRVRERILMCRGTPAYAVSLSILRCEELGLASDDEMSGLENLCETLLALASKHAAMISGRPSFNLPLSSIVQARVIIEQSDVGFTKREAEVCALLVCGMLTSGVAATLGIGEETVATYRKRAYSRLSISTQRELLVWYAEEWGRQSERNWLNSPVFPVAGSLH